MFSAIKNKVNAFLEVPEMELVEVEMFQWAYTSDYYVWHMYSRLSESEPNINGAQVWVKVGTGIKVKVVQEKE